MKIKCILFVSIFVISLLLTSCAHGDIQNDAVEHLQSSTAIVEPQPEPQLQSQPTSSSEQTEDFEILPCVSESIYFSSQREMTQQLNAIRSISSSDERYATYSVLNAQNLSHYYAPSSAIVSDYDFEISRINPNFLWYVYNTKDKGGSIEFEICRIPADDPLLEIEQRYGQQRQNGIVAVPHRHEVYFVIDDAYLGIVRTGGSLSTGTLEELALLEHLTTQITRVQLNSDQMTH